MLLMCTDVLIEVEVDSGVVGISKMYFEYKSTKVFFTRTHNQIKCSNVSEVKIRRKKQSKTFGLIFSFNK